VKDWQPDISFASTLNSSCLLPLIENAFRTGSLLDMFKHYELYHSYILLIKVFAEKGNLINLLTELGPHFLPVQLEPIHELV
jgi:hypothetical protein